MLVSAVGIFLGQSRLFHDSAVWSVTVDSGNQSCCGCIETTCCGLLVFNQPGKQLVQSINQTIIVVE